MGTGRGETGEKRGSGEKELRCSYEGCGKVCRNRTGLVTGVSTGTGVSMRKGRE